MIKRIFLFFLLIYPAFGLSLSRTSVERMYRSSRRVLANVKSVGVDLTWNDLKRKVRTLRGKVKTADYQQTLKWIHLLEFSSKQTNGSVKLAKLYRVRGRHFAEEASFKWVHFGEALLRPDQAAFLRYALDEWKRRNPKLPRPRVTSGYRSPAYQCVVLAQFPGTLKKVLKKVALPGWSRHQNPKPDVSLSLKGFSKSEEKRLVAYLARWGWFRSYPSEPSRKGEFYFTGTYRIYKRFFKSRRGVGYFNEIYPALKGSFFYPHPVYLKAMIAIALQESGFVWNPRLSRIKKKRIGEQINFIFGKGETALSFVFRLMVPRKRKVKLEQLKYDLSRLLSLKNKKVTEYDLQVWMSDFRILITDWVYQNRLLMNVLDLTGKVTEITNRVAHEPQTFGLWQLNVNHFIEKMSLYPSLPKEFRPIYYLEDGKFKVNRDEWIACLSGTTDAALDKEKTMELIFKVVLKDRFENHYRGNLKGLKFFIAENLTGELSTYRAAVQERLNKELGLHLQLDGDLAVYKRYSLDPQEGAKSKTIKVLQKYIKIHLPKQKQHSAKLISHLIHCTTWKELSKDRLYLTIMGKYAGRRIFPDVKSQLYHQSGMAYAKRVLRILRNL